MAKGRVVATANAGITLVAQGGTALLLLPVGWYAIRGDLGASGSGLLVFFIAISRAFRNVKRLTQCLAELQESVGASVRLKELLDEQPDVVEAQNPVRIDRLNEAIRFEDVSFTYRDDEGPVLRGINLELRRGETVALVGPSGSGKSTLVDLLCRFIDPTRGRITVAGHDLRQLALDDWCRLLAHVDQTPFLFHTSIAENVRYGKPDATDAEVQAACRAASIADFVASLPQGYETDVADAGSRLSGGQRQRIVIARAILRNAPLLILDEATSALDSESEAYVQQALERLMSDRTVLVIAHRLSTIRGADRIAVLEGGRLVELGRHDELIGKKGAYARLRALQRTVEV
jgi:ABC-type multidrug transport system fused ATPase/permease subunit